jgi:AcrR family transcriptional regulator
MAQKGARRVTVREIARRAGVEPALVNYYFGGKDGLTAAVIAAVAEPARERMRHAVAGKGNVTERLRALIRVWVGAIAADPYAPKLLLEQALFGEPAIADEFAARFAQPQLGLLSELIDQGRASGELRDIELHFLVPSLVGLCVFPFLATPIVERLFEDWSPTPERAAQLADAISDMVLSGIRRDGAATEPA